MNSPHFESEGFLYNIELFYKELVQYADNIKKGKFFDLNYLYIW
jgi:hypothetical protein